MAAPSVTFDGTRLSSADSNTDGGSWDKWDASQNPAVEPDIVYEGGNSQSNKVGTSAGGVEFFAFTGGTVDFATTPKVMLFKCVATNNSALNVRGATGMIHYIGSGTTTDRYEYYTHGVDAYPLAGGWVFDLIDPNITGYADVTAGTPALGAVDYFAVSADFIATSKSENVAIDAIDYFDVGTGLTLIGGDGASTDAAWEDFRVHQEDTSTNRHGIVRSLDGVLFVLGTLTVGTTVETDFTDTAGGTMVFPDGLFGAGTTGFLVDIQNNNSVFDTANWSFIGRGNTTTDDSRPDYAVSGAGTSASATFTSCAYRVFRNWTLNADTTHVDCIYDAGLLVTQAGGTITGGVFFGATTADGGHYVLSDDPGLISGCDFTFSDGHAVRCDTTGTYAWDGNTDTGYTGTRGTNLVSSSGSNDAMFYNNSGGLITLNVGAGGQSPSVRNGASATTQVNNDITVTFDEMKDDTEVRVYNNSTGVEITGIENATAGSTDDRNFPAVVAGGTVVDYTMVNNLYEIVRVEAFTWPNADQTINIAQRLDRNYNNP